MIRGCHALDMMTSLHRAIELSGLAATVYVVGNSLHGGGDNCLPVGCT